MATISDARPAFVTRQRRSFKWLRFVDLAAYELRADWVAYGDFALPSDEGRYPGVLDVALPLTEERYRIEPFDDSPVVDDLFLTFIRDDSGWLIANDQDLEPMGLFSARHLWDFGPLYSNKSEHFLLLGHPCGYPAAPDPCARVSQELLERAERALGTVATVWRRPWPGKVVILVPGSSEELVRILQVTFDPGEFVAFAYTTVDPADDFKYTGPRIIFNQSSLTTRSDDEISSVLAHELLHVASRGSSGPFVPIFVEEGIADYVGRLGEADALSFLDAEIAAGVFDGHLPRDSDFTTGTGTSIYRSYQESHSAMKFFIERWGLGRLARFYENLGGRHIVPGTPRYHLDDALRATIGMGLRGFERAWAAAVGP